jgi:membrane fusion protein (multidrug efflux system)
VSGPGDLLTTIDELNPVYVTFHPSSQQLLAWQQDPQSRALLAAGARSVGNGDGGANGIAVRVVLPDGSELSRVGRINFMAPSLDSASGTQEFRAQFTNADRRLLPGQFVRVRLEGFQRSNALAVPQRAVQQGLGRQFVYVVGVGDTVTARDVNTGQWSGNLWIIESGLAAGDRVVVDGIQKVAPGRVVKPVAAAADSSSASAVGAKS